MAAGTAHRLHQSFSVGFAYDVVFTRDVFLPDSADLVQVIAQREPARRHRVFVVLDEGLTRAWPELPELVAGYFDRHTARLDLVAPPVVVVGGEAAKNDPEVVSRLHVLFHRHGMDRHSFVLVVGGGSVQDAAGFAAATAHRSLRIVRMPTTVLAQNDSGVGVKNGINAFGVKNFLGTFVPPFAVINDVRFLERLPARDRIAGLAEAVKVALIRDAEFFSWLEAHAAPLAAGDLDTTATMIRRSAELHMHHIASGGDPFEQGSARPLDFGHWAAHKLEALTAHELRHGEAVAIGLLLDSRYAMEIGLLSVPAFERIVTLLARLGLKGWHDALAARDPSGRLAVLVGLDDFREHLGGDLTITLIRDIGHAVDLHAMDESRIETVLAWMRTRHRAP